MIYVPDWETLSNGSARIIAATGASGGDARIALCHAISDQKIALRAIVAKGEYYAGQPMIGRQLGVPLGLTPAAFDWDHGAWGGLFGAVAGGGGPCRERSGVPAESQGQGRSAG